MQTNDREKYFTQPPFFLQNRLFFRQNIEVGVAESVIFHRKKNFSSDTFGRMSFFIYFCTPINIVIQMNRLKEILNELQVSVKDLTIEYPTKS